MDYEAMYDAHRDDREYDDWLSHGDDLRDERKIAAAAKRNGRQRLTDNDIWYLFGCSRSEYERRLANGQYNEQCEREEYDAQLAAGN